MRRSCLWNLTALAVCLGLASAEAATADAATELQQILDAWSKREKASRAVYFRWKELRTFPKGRLTASTRVPELQGRIFPASDVTKTYVWVMRLDGEKMYYSYHGPTWEPVLGRFLQRSYHKFSFDGTRGRLLFGKSAELRQTEGGNGKPGAVRPLGFIYDKKLATDEFGNYHWFPVSVTYRPLQQPPSRLRPDAWTIRGPGIVNGRKCVLLANGSVGGTRLWWVDKERGCIVPRIQQLTPEGETFFQIDIVHSRDLDSGQWVPNKWKLSAFWDPEHPYLFASATVEEYRINPRFEDSDLTFPWPKGTRVRDMSKGRGKEVEYVIHDDGSRRDILDRELAWSHQTLMDTETGESPADNASSFFKSKLFWLGCAVVIFIIAAILWRKQRLTRS